MLDRFFTGQHQRARAVRGLRAVARRHRAARGKHRAQLGQPLHRGVRARALVQADGTGAADDVAGLQVGRAVSHFHGGDLGGELAGLLRFQRFHVGGVGKFVLRLA